VAAFAAFEHSIGKEVDVTVEAFARPAGRSVWLGKDLAKAKDWIFPLPRDTIDEIDHCVVRLRSSGKCLEDIGTSDFPFSTIAEEIEAFTREIATGRGFVVVRGLPSERYSDDELGKIFWGFAAHFGFAMRQSFLGDRLATVMDLTDKEPDPRLRRGYHSAGAQFVHTDACADIVGMISIRTAKQGGASRLASAHAVHNLMLDQCPELLGILYEGFVCRMPDSDADAMGIPALIPHRVPAYTFENGWLNCNYRRGNVMRAVAAGDHQLTPRELAAMDAFASLGNHPDILIEMLLEPGDFQILNNRTVLHGRAHFEDHSEIARRRHLKRLWLSVNEWPKIPAVQGSRYGDNLWK
jgi:TfdA family taurine catabolism dioxygenase TauD